MDKFPSEVIECLLEAVRQLKKIAEIIERSYEEALAEVPKDEQPKAPSGEKQKVAVTLEEVRGVLAEKSRDGFTSDVRNLIAKYGASRLSEIDPKDFGNILKDAEEIGHAG